MREFIRFLLIGSVAAWISSIIVRGRIVRLRGCLVYLIVGVGGAMAGGYLIDLLGWSDILSVVAATFGAIGMLMFLQTMRNA